MTAICSKEVGRVGEESNARDSIIVVEFDPRVLRETRQMGIDFVNQLDVHRKRPKWASSIPFIPTKWVDVNGGGAKQLEYCSRLCEKELKRLSSNVKCDMMSRRVVSATSDVASEPPTDEQVVCQDLLGELSRSLSGMRTEACNWEKKLQEVFDDNTLLLATTCQSRSCRRDRELCGFVHDHFISEGDSVQLTWIESRLKEKLNFERCADLGVDDGVDKMVTILNRLVIWSNQMGIEANPRHRQVLLARMSADGFDICTVLCCGIEMQTDTSRNLIGRTSWELEGYAYVEIRELIDVYIVICQTEEGLVWIMNSCKLTIFLDVKTEVAGFETAE